MNGRPARATLALSTVAFPADQLTDCLQWAAHLHLAAVEIGPHHGPLLRDSPEAAQSAVEQARRLGLVFSSLHAWTQVEGLADVCPTAARLGARRIVVHSRHERLLAAFDQEVAALRHWIPWCARRGVIVTVENSSRQPLEPFCRLFEALPDLRLTLDVKHACKPETLGLTHADYLARLAGRLANLHISGIDRSRDDLLGDGTPPGSDLVDWRRLAADLAALGYGGPITIEWHPPADLTPAQIEEGYGRYEAKDPAETTMHRRVSRYVVEYFREHLAAAL
jgi:sugar phosphate isomerase/epimerase